MKNETLKNVHNLSSEGIIKVNHRIHDTTVKIGEFIRKGWRQVVFVCAFGATFILGYMARDYNVIQQIDACPKTYNEVSTAMNENNELIILKKNKIGYTVQIVLSDSVTRGAFNLLSNKYLMIK